MNFIIILIIIGSLFSNERQNNLESHIQCPCKKGMLSDHASPNAMKLKTLIGELTKDSISMNRIESFVLQTKFLSDNSANIAHQDCLMKNIKLKISNHQISDDGIYNIVSECYGGHLIRKNENNSLIYIILFSIIIIGIILSSWFIFINKKRGL